MSESISAEADRIVNGPRREAYGPPEQSLQRLADLWSPVLGVKVTKEQVCLCLVQLKISREIQSHNRDNLVDICGYALLLGMMKGE